MIIVWIISRQDGERIDRESTFKYKIVRDYINNGQSEFTFNRRLNVKKGDVMIAKLKEKNNISDIFIVDSIDGERITARGLLSLADSTFPATYISGTSFEKHAKKIIETYIINNMDKLASIFVIDAPVTNTPHRYQPEVTPTPTKISTYLQNGFKKYNIVWKFREYKDDKIYCSIEKITKQYEIKNNVYDFVNWQVYESERNNVNKLCIIDSTTIHSENPNILETYYLTESNELIKIMDYGVRMPVVEDYYVYDASTDEGGFLAIAETNLKGNVYSHEIEFSLKKSSLLLDWKKLEIGVLFIIYYYEKEYMSILTGIVEDIDSDYVHLTFGNIRSTLDQLKI